MTQEYKAACMEVVYLASCAVNGETPDAERVKRMNLNELYTAANRHLVTAIIAYALESAGIRDKAFTQAKAKAIRKNVLFDEERAIVLARLEKAGIWYMPLKGSVLKDLYPKTGMRQMADNDILYDVSRSKDIRAIMESLGFRTVSFVKDTYHHDHYNKEPVCNFEMHRALFVPGTDDAIFRYYEKIREKMIPDEGKTCRYHLSPEDFYLYMIAHEYKHFSGGGTGLRSLLDTYVYVKKRGDSLDWEYIAGELETLALTDFERRNRELSLRLFEGEAMSEEDSEMLDYILDSGTYGTMAHRVKKQIEKKGRLRYFISRAFLPYRHMCSLYPVLEKVPVLLPVCWILRWVKALKTKRGVVAYQLRAAMGLTKR